MFRKSKRREHYTTGYHGTTLSVAEDIESGGFRPTEDGVYFVPPQDFEVAKFIGHLRASEKGEPKFAVIEATFPPQELIKVWPYDRLTVPAKQVGQIILGDVVVFDTLSTDIEVPAGLRTPEDAVPKVNPVEDDIL